MTSQTQSYCCFGTSYPHKSLLLCYCKTESISILKNFPSRTNLKPSAMAPFSYSLLHLFLKGYESNSLHFKRTRLAALVVMSFHYNILCTDVYKIKYSEDFKNSKPFLLWFISCDDHCLLLILQFLNINPFFF